MKRPNVKRLERRRDSSGLVGVLNYREETDGGAQGIVDLGVGRRAQAVRALDLLARDGDEEAGAGLGRAAGDPNTGVRRTALAALGDNPVAQAAPGLAAAIASWPEDDEPGRLLAEDVLLRCDAPGSAPALVEALLASRRRPPDVRGLMGDLLVQADDPLERDHCVERLVAALTAREPYVRRTAEVVLAWFEGAPVERLTEALVEPQERVVVARALGRTRDRRAAVPLARLLKDEDREVRRVATHGLAGLRDPRAIEPLLRAMDDDDYEVRTAALEALDQLGGVPLMLGVNGAVRQQLDELSRRLSHLSDSVEAIAEPRQLLAASPERPHERDPGPPLDAELPGEQASGPPPEIAQPHAVGSGESPETALARLQRRLRRA